MTYTSEVFAAMFARDKQMRDSQEGDLQTYQILGEEIGGTYRDGTRAKNWSVVFQYPHCVKQVIAIKGVLVWKKVH